ncbi:MAG: NADH-quinone oxidoreductase subunit NuoH [bacterium]
MSWLYFSLAVTVKVSVIIGVMFLMAPILVWIERKVMGWIQLRPGPSHVGKWGILQPAADGVKMMLKEDITPHESFKPIYLIAPGLVASTALFMFAVIPFGPPSWYIHLSDLHPGLDKFHLGYVTDLNLAVLYLLATSSISVYGVAWGGWSGGSKYSLLGGLRSAAQMISYELTMGATLLTVVAVTGTLSLVEIVGYQAQHGWSIFYQPVTFVLFVITMFAETNRLPFDLPEAEQELTGGYHTEHSSLEFGLFFLGEYLHMVVASSVVSILFLGGWLPPFPGLAIWDSIETIPVVGMLMPLVFFAMKAGFFLFLFIWVRATFPRLRYDQLMKLGWKVLLEVAFVNLFILAFMKVLWTDPNLYWYTWQLVLFLLFIALTNLITWRGEPTESVTLKS